MRRKREGFEVTNVLKRIPARKIIREKGNEVVVSDRYLRQCGLTYSEGMTVELTFTYLGKEEFTETFTMVGVYKRALQPYHVVLVSDDFYPKIPVRLYTGLSY